jgi:dethiobiotin synthetase
MWSHLPTKALERNSQEPPGLLVAGTHARCGKTAFCAGLVGALFELGFRLQALKPLAFLPEKVLYPTYEQDFFNRLSLEQGSDRFRNPQQLDAWATPSAHTVSNADWRRLIHIAQRRVDPYVLEAPGGIGMPILNSDQSLDVIDLARALQAPIILVTSKSSDVLSVVPTALAYAALREAPLLGWLAVETEPMSASALDRWQEDVFYLRRQFQAPYLGELPYSPSISVEAGRQGNLYRLTESSLDLLPIQQTLNLSVPW